jgi:hypothetical protein
LITPDDCGFAVRAQRTSAARWIAIPVGEPNASSK